MGKVTGCMGNKNPLPWWFREGWSFPDGSPREGAEGGGIEVMAEDGRAALGRWEFSQQKGGDLVPH
jgi:hypothetical protein